LPVARPQPLPTPLSAAAGSAPSRTRADAPSPTDPQTARLDLATLSGARYGATLILTPDGGAPASLVLLAEVASRPPAQRLRVTFVDEAGAETVRMDEVLYAEHWYSWSPDVPGEWTQRDASEAPPALELLGKLAWLVDADKIVQEAGRQDLGEAEILGLPARHYRYGMAAVRPEWLQAMDLPALESATLDTWVAADTGALLALEFDGRALTYAGKVHIVAHGALHEVDPEIEIWRPRVCIEVPLPPDVALPAAAVGVQHDCDTWVYTLAADSRAAAEAQEQALAALGWSRVEAECAFPDYAVYAKGVRRLTVSVAAQGESAYVALRVVQAQP